MSAREGRPTPDGTVYVFWQGAIFHHTEQLVAISHDGGVSFSRPIPVAAVTDIPSPLAGSSFRTDSFPTADVNPVTGALHLAWANLDTASNTALIQFTQSDNGGLTWTTPMTIGGAAGKVNAFFPGLAASPDGRHVFIGWPAQTWQPTGTAAGPGVVSQFAAYNLLTVGVGCAHLLSTASGDPDGSSTNALGAQFLGDYATAVASNTTGTFVWTDTRNETPCAAVDAFRAGTTTLKPNPDLSCPASNTGQLFGNSDIFLGAVNF